ncbi:MAG: rhodanese-like domain-containing protein [Bacteroidota bacterium]
MNKKLLLEISVIIGISTLLGILYNFSIPTTKTSKPLALFPEKRVENFISDSVLNAELNGISKDSARPGEDPFKNLALQDSSTMAQMRQDSIRRAQKRVQDSLKAEQMRKDSVNNVPATPKEIRYEQAKLLFDKKVLFMDARDAGHHAEGNIPGSINIDVQDFQANIPKVIGLPREQPVVVYCGGGNCDLSHELANNLSALGFKKVFVYTGGWEEWKTK